MTLLVGAGLIQFAATDVARAVVPESVAMPFDCSVDGPRIVMKPSDTRSYAVIGHREERAVTACTGTGAADCRTMMAHRFAISCGGRRVAWMRVVAAARRTASRDMWIEDGRMHLAVDRRGEADDRCDGTAQRGRARPNADGPSGSRFGLPLMECLPWQRGRRLATVAFPPGFAPLGEIGARIQIGGSVTSDVTAAAYSTANGGGYSAPPSIVATDLETVPVSPNVILTQKQQSPLDQESARLERANMTADQLASATAIPAALTGSDTSRTWVTLVRPETMADAISLARGPSGFVWIAATTLAALLAVAAFAVWRMERASVSVASRQRGMDSATFGVRSEAATEPASVHASTAVPPSRKHDNADPQQSSNAGSAPTEAANAAAAARPAGEGLRATLRNAASRFSGAAPKRPAETSVTNAAASVTALIEQANGSLDVLRGAPPLREVLEQEIGVIRQRLAIVKAQASDGPEAAHKAAPAFRTLVRDLERVRRISESAALSFSRERVTGRLPRTRSEAYDVLGVNADVSDQTLKKLVDALRMCWHPDLARDEPDRLLREERIKCINVAWELISGKRAVA